MLFRKRLSDLFDQEREQLAKNLEATISITPMPSGTRWTK
jgi:hypothetical protein